MNLRYVMSMVAFLGLSGAVRSEPVVLDDAGLARVTAGSYGGWPSTNDAVIVGHAARADIQAPGSVTLDAHAQSGAKALTLVNSARSSVANGSNVWHASTAADAHAAHDSVIQSNLLQQTHATVAYLADWRAQSGSSVVRKTETFDSGFSGGITAEEFTFVGTDTTESVKLGLGAAMAGKGNAEFGTFGLTFSDEFTSSLTTTTSTTVTVKFNFLFFKRSKSYTHTDTESSTSTATNHGDKSWGPFSASFNGVECLVLLGSCSDSGHFSSSSHTEEKSLSPAQVQGASAKSIVLGDGALVVNAGSSVKLEGHAQNGISAVHAVNAAGSLSANGLNVSSRIPAASMPRGLQLQQSNLIAQRP